jgi:hypothetical protein
VVFLAGSYYLENNFSGQLHRLVKTASGEHCSSSYSAVLYTLRPSICLAGVFGHWRGRAHFLAFTDSVFICLKYVFKLQLWLLKIG